MTGDSILRGIEVRSLVTSDGRLELSLQKVEIAEPGPDQVVIRVEATPVHPSDIGLLLGPVDLKSLATTGSASRPVASGTMLKDRMDLMKPRIGQSMPVGNEGAGTVIKAGANALDLLGKVVTSASGGMYTQYRLADASSCLVLPDDITPAQGAAAFVNPMTALSLLETMRMDGHTAMIHTAAASTLGQMLVRLCKADGVPLVNVVRSAEQAAVLRDIGAEHVVDSSLPGFPQALTDAVAATGAMVAFDAVGGGSLPGELLAAMERALNRNATVYSRYGSSTHKQVYVYGALNPAPITIDRSSIGMYWGVDSFMVGSFLGKIGTERRKQLEARILAELDTTFAIHYTAEVSMADLLSPENLLAIAKRATGRKYLINPAKNV